MTTTTELCPNCEVAATLVRERRIVALGQRRVDVDLEFFRCPECNEEYYSLEQADLRHRRAVDKARFEDNLLSPNQIKSIREGLNLSQRMFELILGVGEKTCVRWEQGRVCQNVSTDRLIRLLAADRENIQRLAAINGVVLPDSCFVPPAPTAPEYAGAVADWEREFADPNFIAQFIVMGGSQEVPLLETAEHKAIISAATKPIAVRLVNTTPTGDLAKFRTLPPGGRIQ
jgi:putative zinc finger/helix-turn-helix YgiT family protein